MDKLLQLITSELMHGIEIECSSRLNLRQALERYGGYPSVADDGPENGIIAYLSRDKVPSYHIVSYEKEIPEDNLGAMRRGDDPVSGDKVILLPVNDHNKFAPIARTITTTDGEYVHVDTNNRCIYASHEILRNKRVLNALRVSYRTLCSVNDLMPLKDLEPCAYYEDDVSCVWLKKGDILYTVPNNDDTRLKWDVKIRIMTMVRFQHEHYEVPETIIGYIADLKAGGILPAGDLYLIRRKGISDPKSGTIVAIVDPKCRGKHNAKVIRPESVLYTNLDPAWSGVHPKVAVAIISNIYDSWSKGDILEYPRIEDALTLQGIFQAIRFVRSPT